MLCVRIPGDSAVNYCCLQVLDEFYENLKTVGVSAITGEGMEEMFGLVDECRDEYFKYYKAELDRRAKASLLLTIISIANKYLAFE